MVFENSNKQKSLIISERTKYKCLRMWYSTNVEEIKKELWRLCLFWQIWRPRADGWFSQKKRWKYQIWPEEDVRSLEETNYQRQDWKEFE